MPSGGSLKYLEVAGHIRGRIVSGEYPVGQVIPGQRELAVTLGVSRPSLARAIEELTKEGIVECKASVGTIVRRKPISRMLVAYLVNDLSDLVDPFHSEIIREVERLLRITGAALVVSPSPDIERVRAMGASMAVVSGGLVRKIGDVPVPCVYVGIGKKGENLVQADNQNGMRLVYEHLRSLGHSVLGYIGTIEDKGFDVRFDSLRRLMSDAGQKLPEANVVWLDFSDGARCAAEITRLLASRPVPTALICYNDWSALRVIHLLSQQGISVPGAMSVTGYDDLLIGRSLPVSLTTVRFPIDKAAQKVIEILFDSKKNAPVVETLPAELVVRDSTANVQ